MFFDIAATSGRQYRRAGNKKKSRNGTTIKQSDVKLETAPEPQEGQQIVRRAALLRRPPSLRLLAFILSTSARHRTYTVHVLSLSGLFISLFCFVFLIWSESLQFSFILFYLGTKRMRKVTGWAPAPRPAAATRSDPSPSSRLLKTPAGRQSATPKTHQIIISSRRRKKRRRPQAATLVCSALSLLIIATFPATSLHDSQEARRKIWHIQMFIVKAAILQYIYTILKYYEISTSIKIYSKSTHWNKSIAELMVQLGPLFL